ncbi:hypothetical protein OF83DRAFT_615071, partial [Amylostereum chailletii]
KRRPRARWTDTRSLLATTTTTTPSFHSLPLVVEHDVHVHHLPHCTFDLWTLPHRLPQPSPMAPLKPRPRLATRASDDTWVHDKAPRDPATRSTPANGPPTNKLMITNLHYEVMPKDLMAIFGQIGTLVREPHIRYDRSGRSSGIAIVTYETPTEATRARNQLNGMTAKGQPMTVEFDREVPRRASAPAAPSLLSRIQTPKAPLLARLGQSESSAKAAIAKNTKVAAVRGKARPGARGRGGGGGSGGGGGGGGGGGSKGSAAPRQKPKPKTAQELDSELDTFMVGPSAPAPAPAPVADSNGDVEMS